MPTFVKLLIPIALATAVFVAALTVKPPEPHAKPAPTRSLQLHR